jgi:hypothetical protein
LLRVAAAGIVRALPAARIERLLTGIVAEP